MENIYGITLKKLEEYFIKKGEKKFKASQVYDWLYKKRITSFDDMSNIKKEVKAYLKEDYNLDNLKILAKQVDVDVVKYLFLLDDNNKIEAVLMKHDYGNSLCVSSQVGCNMGCSFCESGRLKKVRNLKAHEMVLQLLQVEKDLNIRISHLVLMGIGEPFDNYDNVIDFIDIINNDKGIALGSRHITVSTSGIVPKIKQFSDLEKQVNLAISLHASNNDLRNKLMPINKVYNLDLLIETVKEYIKKTNRRVTFEYILLKDINDKYENAIELSKLLKGMNCYINLIPYNETSHIEYKKSSQDSILKFYDTLKKNNINVTIRREFGHKVSAACGQLRANYEEEY
jgi:23S rRNA (adenine2503-C2)-methyltransferase